MFCGSLEEILLCDCSSPSKVNFELAPSSSHSKWTFLANSHRFCSLPSKCTWVRSGTKQISRSCAKWVWIGGNLKRLVLALVLREVHTSAKFSGFDFSGSNRCIKFNIVVSIWFIPIAFAQAWFKLIVVAVPGLKPQDQIWFSCPSQQHGRAQVTCYPRMGLEVSLRLRRYWLFFSLASIYM